MPKGHQIFLALFKLLDSWRDLISFLGGSMQKFLVGLMAVGLSTAVTARPLTIEEKNADIQQVGSLIRSQYAPLELKTKTLNLKLADLLHSYSGKAEKLSNTEFYYLLNQLVAEFQ